MRSPALRACLPAVTSRITFVESLAYALIVASPLTVYRVGIGVNLSLQRAILLALVAALAFELLRRARRLVRPSRRAALALAAMFAFFLYELSQLPRSDQSDFSMRFLGGFAGGIVIVVALTIVINNERVLRRAIGAFFLSGIVPIAIGLYQMAGPRLGYVPTLPFATWLSVDPIFLGNFSTQIEGVTVPRVPSTLAAPAFFGEFLAFVALAMLASMLMASPPAPWRLLPMAALVALAIVNLVATFARSAWFLFVIGVVLVAWQARRQLVDALFGRGRRWLLPALAIMCVAILPLVPVSPGSAVVGAVQSIDLRRDAPGPVVEEPFAGEILTLNPPVDVNSAASSTLTHLALRESALDLFAQQPLTGIGLGNYGVRTAQFTGVSSAQTYGFTVLAEGGLIGFGLFVAMLVALTVAVRHAYLTQFRDTSLSGPVLGLYVVIALLALNNLVLYDTFFRDTSWVVIALAVAAANFAAARTSSASTGDVASRC